MTSSYNDIYSRFLNKIQDYEFAGLPEPNATAQMREWLRSSVANPYVFRIFDGKTFTADDEIAEFEYTLTDTTNDFADKNFVEELLANQMCVEWLTPKVRTTKLINQMITNSKEEKFFSQQQHLGQLRELLADFEDKVRGMLRDRGYIYNSYLGNVNG